MPESGTPKGPIFREVEKLLVLHFAENRGQIVQERAIVRERERESRKRPVPRAAHSRNTGNSPQPLPPSRRPGIITERCWSASTDFQDSVGATIEGAGAGRIVRMGAAPFGAAGLAAG